MLVGGVDSSNSRKYYLFDMKVVEPTYP